MNYFDEHVRPVAEYLREYLKNPVARVGSLPDWSWSQVLIVQMLFALLSGVLAGVVNQSVWILAAGILFVPIVSLITVFICTLFLYYTIQLFLNSQLYFLKLFILIVLANIPFLIFQIISNFVPPVNLIGFAFTCVLIAIGLVESFVLPKKAVLKMILVLYLGFVMIWIFGRIENSLAHSANKQVSTYRLNISE